jgi:geranylgeranylglycerol-phosphate geranylgeranyltransferase
MNSDRLRAVLQLFRPMNSAFVVLCILAGAVIAAGAEAWAGAVFLASVAGALAAAGGYAINDYFDIEIDRINKPDRPLPREALSRRAALVSWAIVSSSALALGSMLPAQAFAIVVFWVIALYVYAGRLKRTALVGNALVAAMTGLTFVLGAMAVGQTERALFPALFAFLANFAREVLKDVEDREGDEQQGASTFPIRHGVKAALRLTSAVLLALIAATVVAFVVGAFNVRYLVAVLVVDGLILFTVVAMWRRQDPAHLNRLNNHLKWIMVLGLAAMLVGIEG